jgi:hypothetical protein
MKFYHYVMLSLIVLINGQRGKDFIISLLRGSRSRKVSYILRKEDLWGFYNLFSLSTRSELASIFEELRNGKQIEIREEELSDGFIYPLVYITSQGKEYLQQNAERLKPRLDELLMLNERLIEFQTSLKTRAYSAGEVRKLYARAYEKWTREEDKNLENEFRKGYTVLKLAELFQRQPGAIRSRLNKLGLTI